MTGTDTPGDRARAPGNSSTDNHISAEYIEGPVGQFGSVYGDVNMAHPRTPEEAYFRDRYIKKKQEEWDAEERWKNSPVRKTMATIWVVFLVLGILGFIIAFVVVLCVMAVKPHGDQTGQMNGDSAFCTVGGTPSDDCPPAASLLPFLPDKPDRG